VVENAKKVSTVPHLPYFIIHMVSWGCCDKTLLLCKPCLRAVYHRPMA